VFFNVLFYLPVYSYHRRKPEADVSHSIAAPAGLGENAVAVRYSHEEFSARVGEFRDCIASCVCVGSIRH
jgi:hypothetical protein